MNEEINENSATGNNLMYSFFFESDKIDIRDRILDSLDDLEYSCNYLKLQTVKLVAHCPVL